MWRIILYDYLFTTELRHIFWSRLLILRNILEVINAYISNGRRFTKSALRILLLSTFRVSSINFYRACSLLIHTRSPTNAEGPRAHCQSKSCKMLYKCSTDCIWNGLQPVWPSRSFKVTAVAVIFDWPYTISLVFHCKYISALHRLRDINT